MAAARVLVSAAVQATPCPALQLVQALVQTGLQETDHGWASHAAMWLIDTKYYTAEAEVCVVPAVEHGKTAQLPDDVASTVAAIVLVVDTSQAVLTETLESTWLPFVAAHQPEILLLVDAFQPEQMVPRVVELESIVPWCVEHGFELVELNPTPDGGAEGYEADADDEEGGDGELFREMVGIDRIREAMHVYAWPGMTMKARPHKKSSSSRQPASSSALTEPITTSVMIPDDAPLSVLKPVDRLKCDNPFCTVVESDTVTLKQCSRCKSQRYCSKECQTAAWKAGHKSVCIPSTDKLKPAEGKSGDLDLESLMQSLGVLNEAREAEKRGDKVSTAQLERHDESFQTVVDQLKAFRAKKDMPMELRREYAEKVALSFMTAMGLDDDDDDDAQEGRGAADETVEAPSAAEPGQAADKQEPGGHTE